ncbi:hypothetical protein [Streptomyces tagetis]|uniref:Secreted protein n=1 Tax=Streptomyces tagetis TaxID=2820809 RepID=A0A940XT04_9ACTN|nr:hypothetical protein [Streptomyces sp. RG38]MBQ0829118.1 hypothetical protein [Streptomyces sp. RG38]
MAAMRRGLVHVLAWLLATGAAVTLSWWGVRTVLAGTVYDPPRALPITAADTGAGLRDATSSTALPSPPVPLPPSPSPSPSPSPGGSSAAPEPEPPPAAPAGSPAPEAPADPGPPDGAPGRVEGYDTAGGRAVFDLGTESASLVSAAPGPGWSMQVWKTESWIRVEFTSDTDRVSVFCTWHDGPPRVEIGSY